MSHIGIIDRVGAKSAMIAQVPPLFAKHGTDLFFVQKAGMVTPNGNR
jgi:hypothetical protein